MLVKHSNMNQDKDVSRYIGKKRLDIDFNAYRNALN